jgi:hypothetical protein
MSVVEEGVIHFSKAEMKGLGLFCENCPLGYSCRIDGKNQSAIINDSASSKYSDTEISTNASCKPELSEKINV